MNIVDSPEYALLDTKLKTKFSAVFISNEAQETKKKLGANIEITVVSTLGKEVSLTVNLTSSFGTIAPEHSYLKEVRFVYEYRVPGKRVIKFTRQEFMKSVQVMHMQKVFAEIDRQDKEKRVQDAIVEMRSLLSPAARQAIKDGLHLLCDRKHSKKLHAWFKKQKFENVPDAIEFEKMNNLSSIILSDQQDKFSHSKGVIATIDWVNKKFITQQWSSDD